MKKYYTIESNAWDRNSEIRLGSVPIAIDKRAYLFDEWQYINDQEEFIYTVSEFSGLKKIVGSFVINDREVGNYKIFKIKDILNRFWVVSEEIKEKIERAGLVGIKLLGLPEYYGL